MTQITRVQRQLHAFILSMVWNATEADDVLQQTNLVLWEKSAEFDASRPFLPWAMQFAQWQALAWLKQRQRQRLVFDDDLAKLLADEAVADERAFEARRNALASCLQKLGPEQRELIARRYEPEASVNALAAAGGVTAKALSDRLRRIRHALLECIQRTIAEEAFS
ncbi:sigma-70 family RNA polymerase sigma factor [Anatilimnocola aggregata]|uniref:sigma-70 family RNA polymerase sigma factor n=1 Tax=Anatilimnocola aggregata TaxID=2528021 RepID=UPI00192E5316|nr:sigma-70 family RNA polymerase sigma factor [Anatilimnocola aggregata]